jgi:hypothetical protein
LSQEFGSLLRAYNLNWTLPAKCHRSRSELGARQTADSLIFQTMKQIEVIYEKDFALGGYEMLSGEVVP